MINVMATEISKEEARSKEMQDINQEKEIGAVAIADPSAVRATELQQRIRQG